MSGPQEGLYPMAHVDGQGRRLSGHRRYRLSSPAGALPPARAFWSVTMYDDGFLVPKPMNRHAIGDRTRGLQRDSEDSLTLTVQHAVPDDPANWLPSPTGAFYLMLRRFAPHVDAFVRWRPPPVEPVTVD